MMNELENEKSHPSMFEPVAFIVNIFCAVLGAIIGMQLITTLGVTPNTSIIGALIAMLISRIPLSILQKFRSIHRQNIVQTSISSATFGAANSLMIPIGIPFLIGRNDLVLPMLIGVSFAMIVDATILYNVFDSEIFPGTGAWPPGVATAQSILAGDKGGKRAGILGIGTTVGVIGSFLHIPMSAFGIAFIGNIWALFMFGVGLLINQYSMSLFGINVNKLYIPHGIMIGAGFVAICQIFKVIFIKQKETKLQNKGVNVKYTRSTGRVKRTLLLGYVIYAIIASGIAIVCGLITKMSTGMFIGFILYAAVAAFVHELLVGIAAMHSGWFPAFAIAFITLIVGMLIGFPPIALALLAGFSAATGPAFADMGYDLKSGYILRGNGKDNKFELEGRKHQYIAAIVAFAIAMIIIFLSYKSYFGHSLVPPIDKVYISTIKAGASAEVAKQLLIWMIPGVILQLIGGASRQLGVLFATGLLITSPNACWAVLVGILIRVVCIKIKGKEAETPMSIFAGGVIAGDALFSFFGSIFKVGK
ncbi:OPT/YSL family transporter [Clostridium autoethanogenum]|nr:OPT/YSL family transporter [Clostridium autoethanogenum]